MISSGVRMRGIRGSLLLLTCLVTLSHGYWYWDGSSWQPCNCNNMATTCEFDPELMNATGDGGRCQDCQGHTTGAHCEQCMPGYYPQDAATEPCAPCACNTLGSVSEECDHVGSCTCRGDVTGSKCDQCPPGYFDLGPTGCRKCACSPAGTVGNTRDCPTGSNGCECKTHVKGVRCDQCMPGHFALNSVNPDGCFKCFCFRHTANCTQADGYSVQEVRSNFKTGPQGWSIVSTTGSDVDGVPVGFNPRQQAIFIKSNGTTTENLYFNAPDTYVGNKLLSHRLNLHFVLRVGSSNVTESANDVIIEGGGFRVTCPINAQGNLLPAPYYQRYKFRLSASDGWEPRLSDEDFATMLSKMTSLRIRGTYGYPGYSELMRIRLEEARPETGSPVATAEKCACPEGYSGDSCQSCAPGYHRNPPRDDPLSRCVPCQCHDHADTCDVITGKCACKHSTTGDRCDRCLPGYYGDPRRGNHDDCRKCPCPFEGDCAVTRDGDVICIDCRQGYTGKDCTYCLDGYYGDPQARHFIIARPCRKCDCSGNVDPNAVGFCDALTGVCTKCSYNTTGDHCQRCLHGFYGNALGTPKGNCKPCDCDLTGTRDGMTDECDVSTGQCACLDHVTGRKCGECEPGYWGLEGGCRPCQCSGSGVASTSCEPRTGECTCREGFTGTGCDVCLPDWHRATESTCAPCACHQGGATSQQCDVTGACTCSENAVGEKCDTCAENTYDVTSGCRDCPVCYREFLQPAADSLRQLTRQMALLLNQTRSGERGQEEEGVMLGVRQLAAELLVLRDAASAKYSRTEGPPGMQLEEAENTATWLQERRLVAVTEVITRTSQLHHDVRVTADILRDVMEEAVLAVDDLFASLEGGRNVISAAKRMIKDRGPLSDAMTTVAKEARGFSHLLLMVANQIGNITAGSLSKSARAGQVLRSLPRQNARVTAAIDEISISWVRREANFRQGRVIAQSAIKEASGVYEAAIGDYTSVAGLRIPAVNLTGARQILKVTSAKAGDVMAAGRRFARSYQGHVDMAEFLVMDTEDFLERGERERNWSRKYSARVSAAHNMAARAAGNAGRIIDDAETTLEVLQDFDQKTQEQKTDAERALENLGPATEQVKAAEENMNRSAQLLGDSLHLAEISAAIGTAAEDGAERASAMANQTLGQLETLRERAYKENNISDAAASHLRTLTFEWADQERQANMNRLLSKAAITDADDTRNIAAKSETLLDDSLRALAVLLDTIDALGSDDLQQAKLEKMEDKLDDLEETWMDADMRVRIIDLDRSIHSQGKMINLVSAELFSLKSDAELVKNIEKSVPKTCFSNPNIEPINPRFKWRS